MLTIRPYNPTDAATILSWCQEERAFYQWTAGAKRASLGVFENNLPAYYCYKAVGFEDVILDEMETYSVLGEKWKCRELAIENRDLKR